MKTFTTLACLALLALAAAPAQSNEPLYSQAELDQMLAPVALYPDAVLTHVLIAATYPVQVVQAARWSAENPGLEGDAALAAAEAQPWDTSVHALVAFPELLARMSDDSRRKERSWTPCSNCANARTTRAICRARTKSASCARPKRS